MTTTFADLQLRPELLEALTSLGYEEPTPIQREAIGPLLAGRDLLGQAATGTGKTAAFALPLLQQLGEDRSGVPSALVLVPTRELAVQVSQALHRYGRALGARVLPVYGGAEFGQQARALDRGVDVVVATPGRALDHVRRGTMRLSGVAVAVLDEADEMLDMGFADDIDAILSETPKERQGKCRRLARAGGGLAEQILAPQQRRDRLALDRRRLLVAQRGERVEQLGTQGEVGEAAGVPGLALGGGGHRAGSSGRRAPSLPAQAMRTRRVIWPLASQNVRRLAR